jgi:signal transduction histidine kinase
LAVVGLVLVQAAAAGWSREAFADAGFGGHVSLVISVLLGLWVTGLMRESDRRAALIGELERTRAELAVAEHDRGVLSERQRLAHEIHDTLAQGFASIIALSQAAEAAISVDPSAARDRILPVERTAPGQSGRGPRPGYRSDSGGPGRRHPRRGRAAAGEPLRT